MDLEQTILSRYQNADEDQRLALFLAHRELRDQFMIIEQQTRTLPSEVQSATRSSSLKQLWYSLNSGLCHAIRRGLAKS